MMLQHDITTSNIGHNSDPRLEQVWVLAQCNKQKIGDTQKKADT